MQDAVKKYLKYIVMVSILTFVTVSILFQNDTIMDNISKTIPIVTLVYYLYSKYLWRYNPFEKTPKLKEKYSGHFISIYQNKTRKHKVNLKIKQTLFNIKIIYQTKESCSHSINANIYCERGEYKLIYNYLNEPDNQYRSRSGIHYGTCILSLDNPKTIKGKYFTDRETKGDIFLEVDNAVESTGL